MQQQYLPILLLSKHVNFHHIYYNHEFQFNITKRKFNVIKNI